MSSYDNEKIMCLLKVQGFKLTTQRKSVLDAMLEHSGEHMTVEQIYQIVKKNNPEIGLATVYRTIQLFHDLKIIDEFNLNDGFIRYEMGSFNQGHRHHHLICEKCQKVIEVEDDMLDTLEQTCLTKYNFEVKNHIVKVYGICQQCRS